MRQSGDHFALFFNERETPIDLQMSIAIEGTKRWVDPTTGTASEPMSNARLQLAPWQSALLWIAPT
jgi:hypothetical protein